MRRRLIGGMMVLGAAALAVAQQDDASRQRWLQWRETQNKAIQAIQADGVKLRAAFDEAGRVTPAPEKWAGLSEREREEFRRANRARWEEHLKVLGDIEEQVAMLKGPWQLRTELDDAIQELAAIRDLARQEKAVKAAERIQSLIDRRQAKHDQMVKKFGPLP
ncbi:MAG TPA: hypothetical protein VLI39_03010 [Sedimentisphaerales bacterium]|nr:hypothetical protein [Sedimentisphaerales bacterium]